MKRILVALCALLCASAFGTTLNPVQLLNPLGSSSGQTIVSTGASTAPGWSNIPVANVTGAAALAGSTFTGPITPSQTSGIVGTTTNNNANAGSVGEFITANANSISLTTGISVNITSISLTAGDWDVTGTAGVVPAGTTTVQGIAVGISTTTGTLPGGLSGQQATTGPNSGAGITLFTPLPLVRLSLSATTTVFLVISPSFSVSTCTGAGVIRARRVR